MKTPIGEMGNAELLSKLELKVIVSNSIDINKCSELQAELNDLREEILKRMMR